MTSKWGCGGQDVPDKDVPDKDPDGPVVSDKYFPFYK